MIDSKDLRVGNIVEYKGKMWDEETKTMVKTSNMVMIQSIIKGKQADLVTFHIGESKITAGTDKIHGIPITEEHLGKLFKSGDAWDIHRKIHVERDTDGFSLVVRSLDSDGAVQTDVLKKIKYLHQLQQAVMFFTCEEMKELTVEVK